MAWLKRPHFSAVLKFAVSITGEEGKPLLVFYIIAVCVGLFYWNRIAANGWVVALFASCLFLPAGIVLLISETYRPLFSSRYFIFSMSFLEILAAAGIVRLLYAVAPILNSSGALLLALILMFSMIGVKDYFTRFQKEDWKGLCDFLAAHCSSPEDPAPYIIRPGHNAISFTTVASSQYRIQSWKMRSQMAINRKSVH